MSKENIDRAERDRKKKTERAEKDKAKTARKAREKEDKAEKAREVGEKAERVEEDRVERARQSERARLFEEVLSGASTHSKGCCEPCNFHVRTNNGEYQPCKLGHQDSGPNKEICADCSESRYHPKK